MVMRSNHESTHTVLDFTTTFAATLVRARLEKNKSSLLAWNQLKYLRWTFDFFFSAGCSEPQEVICSGIAVRKWSKHSFLGRRAAPLLLKMQLLGTVALPLGNLRPHLHCTSRIIKGEGGLSQGSHYNKSYNKKNNGDKHPQKHNRNGSSSSSLAPWKGQRVVSEARLLSWRWTGIVMQLPPQTISMLSRPCHCLRTYVVAMFFPKGNVLTADCGPLSSFYWI